MKSDQEHLDRNLDSVLEVQRRDWDQRTPSQRRVERISRVIGQPLYLAVLLCVVTLWIALNEILPSLGFTAFDPYPYALLDGVMTLAALISATVILIAQSRQTRLEQQHTHIALQVNLLTEQKVTTLISMLEELRKDLPMVKDRVDPHIDALKKRADAAEIHAAIEEAGLGKDIEPEGDDAAANRPEK